MASILRVNTLTDASSNNSTAMSTINQGTAKAWSNYVTASSFSINDSFNYASITDSGAGFATHNFTNAFANALFSYVGLAEVSSADAVTVIGYTTNKTTTTCRQVSYNSSNSATDQPGNSFSAHGELA